jgi:hypothetical protein
MTTHHATNDASPTPGVSLVAVVTPEGLGEAVSIAGGGESGNVETHLDPPLLSVQHEPHSPLAIVPTELESVDKNRFHKPEIVRERSAKRRRTSMTIDNTSGEDSNYSVTRNIILPLDGLVKFLEENFVCKRCRKCLTTSVGANGDDEQQRPPLGLEVFGLACGLNFNCDCGVNASLRPDLVPEAHDKIKTLKKGKPYATRVNCGDFEINRRLCLGLQLCGDGRQDGNIIAGMLKLNVNPMQRRWTEIQELLGQAIIRVGEEVLDENLHIECKLSPIGVDGRHALDVASDTRWDKRGSSRRYDSVSGCSVAFGLRSSLPIGIEAMSTVCIKCTKGTDHNKEVCPKNYEGSSKGMEATGAVRIVRRLFENLKHNCYVAHLVTDDDSSVRKILTHSYKELLAALRITAAEWPKYPNGKKKPDNGMLPLLHEIIIFLADKGHRVRGYSRFLFVEAAKSVANGCGCTKVDAERMKRRLSWTLRLHCLGTYDEFKVAVRAVLEHHFNNHEFCGAWCVSATGTEEEVRETGLRFRCKLRHSELYLVLKTHHEQFMEDEKLKQLFHSYDTNLVEGFNKFLTKFLPKDRTYSQTIENKARTMVAVGLQSIGYRQFYKRVFSLTGIEMCDDDITYLFLRSEDGQKLWRKMNRKIESVKITRMRTLYKKLRDGVEKLKADNAKELGYETNMMGPGGGEGDHGRRQKKKTGDGSKPICKHCGSDTHSRRTSKDCPKNPKNLRGKIPRDKSVTIRDAM